MKSKFFFGFVLVISLILVPYKIYAASGVPQTISYQGRLLDSSGNLLGGSAGTTYYFRYSIWDAATGGTVGTDRLWPASGPTPVTAVVRNGVFNSNIDVSGYNPNANSSIYLQVEVSSDGGATYEALSPRQSITAVMFAQLAGAVVGVGQSAMGTLTPAAGTVLTVSATSTNSRPVLIQAWASQVADLLRIEDAASNHLFSIDASGNVYASSSLTVQTEVILGNKFKLKQTSESTTVLYDSTGAEMLQFDENQ